MKNEDPRRASQGAAGAEDQHQQEQSTEFSAAPQSSGATASAPQHSVDEVARQFLRLILPECGPYVLWVKSPRGGKFNEFAVTIEELWQKEKSWDARGANVYHACASFKETKHDAKGTPRGKRRFGRTAHNVALLKAFFLDIDAGPLKSYKTAHEAAEALLAFCRTVGLPDPILVFSGNGLHAYWPLETVLPPDEWRAYAEDLKVLCSQHGMHADPSRTADVSSVLRTPGTHNRKNGSEREVTIGELVGPYKLEQFACLRKVTPSDRERLKKKTKNGFDFGEMPGYLKGRFNRNLVDRANVDSLPPASANAVADNCEQLRDFRGKRGQLPEPLWYAGLGVLAHCKDGDRIGHEWSRGDSRYTERETQERLDRVKEFGPTTCTKFHNLKRAPCDACPHWQKITSPIQLGHDSGRENPSSASNERGGEEEEADQHLDKSKGDSEDQRDKARANSETAKNPYALRWHGECDLSLRREWLVKKMIPRTGIGLLSGQWGTSKTFIAIDLAGAVMISSSFAGRAVARKGGVVFLAAEGSGEIPIRVSGILEAKYPAHKGKLPFAWAESCPALTENGAIDKLTRIVAEAADRMHSEFAAELALIIIDTMSAAAGFIDENSSSEGQRAMNVLAELSRRTGAFVMGCDHFGKAVETGTRGTSAKEAAADVVIACLGDRSVTGRIANPRIAIRKLRGGATGAETEYALRVVDLGTDEDREQITTCFVEWSPVTVGPAPNAGKGKEWPKRATLFRAALLHTLELYGRDVIPFEGQPLVRAVELDKVREEFAKRSPLDDDGQRNSQLSKRRQVFRRSRAEAEARGLIGCRDIEGKFMIWTLNPEDRAKPS